MSEPLEVESVVELEPDIDPDDVETEDVPSIVEELADDSSIFPPHDEDMPSEDHSLGLSFEQMEETFNTLAKEDSSEEENEAATAVLNAVAGTGIFEFFMLQDKLNKKAKALMKKTEDMEVKENESGFDIRKFIGDDT